MNNENEKYLPIGTIVLLKEANKKLMITGYGIKPEKDQNKIYDYMGCLYPEGIIDLERIALFNHEQIEKIISLGYTDEEGKQLREKIKLLLEGKING